VPKPIEAVAALQLVEEGLLGLDDPVDGVLPELEDRRALPDPHGSLDRRVVVGPRQPAVLATFAGGQW
jgi:CubicO group peptidase (beta-lactamase class C family)